MASATRTLSTTRRLLLASGAAFLAAASVPAASVEAAEPTEINFGVISTDSSQNIKAQWTPFLQDMEKATGLKVNGFFPSDYAGVIEAMRFGKVQLAWYGNASAILAVDRADGEVFAQKTYADGTKGYYSLLIVNKDSPVHSLEDLLRSPGKYTFGNGDPNSTSGFLVPGYYLWAKNDINPRKFFKNIVTANHGTNLIAVANHQVDVATNNTEELDKFVTGRPTLDGSPILFPGGPRPAVRPFSIAPHDGCAHVSHRGRDRRLSSRYIRHWVKSGGKNSRAS